MQLNYDYFTTSECKVLKSKVQTNPRYKNFTQLYYTVGDAEQFWAANNLSNVEDKNVIVESYNLPSNNIFKNINMFEVYHKYKNVSEAEVENTFNYIFNKFKKGIFIKIRNGQLAAFIPFSKAFFINEWSNLIKINPKYNNIENFFKVQHDLSNKLNGTSYKFNPNKINMNPEYWYANNCILRVENPINEGENNYPQLKSMFLELCSERQIPDMDFFVNRRDFPILTRNGTEPYHNIYGDNVPLKSFKFEKYLPILSMCSSEKYADIAIPTHEDWSRVKSNEGVFFPPKCRNYTFNFNLKWITKKNLAVFRGSNTGCGYNVNNNTRLKLAKLGVQYPQYLDVGITNWNLRIRKNKDSSYLEIPNISDLKLVNKLSPEQQSNYKYLINVDGHVSAFRLSLELSMGCCILMVESEEKWKMWFSDMLEPYIHYIPIKADLSDLISQIQWCHKNDEKCHKISKNALIFYNTYLTKKGVLDYLQSTLFKLRKEMYGEKLNLKPTIDPLLFLSEVEHEALINHQNNQNYKITGLFPKNVGRNYGSLKGLEKFIESSIKSDNQISLIGVENHILFKSKTNYVMLYQIGAENVVVKRTIDKMKKIEFIHEAFIGKFVINNFLKFCPHFVFTLSYRDEPYITYIPGINSPTDIKETTVIQEYIQGPTLQKFLQNCTFKSYLEILLSLTCALNIAQTQYGFVHHDLKPWNIMVNILPESEPIILEYYFSESNQTYKIKTRYVPIIIDYGKSHVIYNNIHYGIIEPFTVNKNIDIVTLLISTINEIILNNSRQNKENIDYNDLFFIMNFISSKKILNIHQLQSFIYKNKKFNNLNKEDLTFVNEEGKTIFESFIKYISPLNKKYRISFGKDNLTLNLWSSNSRQISDMGFGLELEDKINSYLDVVKRIYKNPLPQSSNRFTTILIAQKLFNGLIIPKMEFIEFANQQKLERDKVILVLKEYEKMEKFIMEFYIKQLNKKKNIPFNLGINQKDYENILNFDIKPSRQLFLNSEKVEINQKLPPTIPNYIHFKNLILEVMRNKGPFQMHEEDKKFYMDNFKLIFNETFISKIVDIETIRFFLK